MDNGLRSLTKEPFAYIYAKPPISLACCNENFVDHLSWKSHMTVKHPTKSLLYICSRCDRRFPKINGVSIHFSKCKCVIVSSVVPPTEAESAEVFPPIPAQAEITDSQHSVASEQFQCKWCDLAFGTKTGLGVHARRIHPSEFEETKSYVRVKARWSDEELKVLAITELNLQTTKAINQQLQNYFPARSYESLKGMRKQPRYKTILEEVRSRIPLNIGTPRRLPTIESQGTPRRLPRRPPVAPVAPVPVPDMSETVSVDDSLIGTDPHDVFLRSLLESSANSKDRRLAELVRNEADGNDMFDDFSSYIGTKFKLSEQSNRRAGNSDTTMYRRKVKLKRYARYQQLFRKNRKMLADIVLNDKEEATVFPSEASIRSVYQKIFESESPSDDSIAALPKVTPDLFYPVTVDEIKAYKRGLGKTSPGVDNFTTGHLIKADDNLLASISNYQLMKKRQLSCWKENKTVLIPKGNDNLDDASNWRPITISSLFVRMLHKILADRISKAITLNLRQKAFVPVDGCAENVNILDTLIYNSRKHHKHLSILGIDLAKAFDTISHHSIQRALNRFGIAQNLIEYIMSSYKDCTTTILCGNLKIPHIQLNRGVKQGDPLSPILFNMIMDEFLDLLPDEVGVELHETTFNSLAFADDLILLSKSSAGMNHLIGIMEQFFTGRNLKVNVKKCFSLVLTTTIKDRAPIVIKSSTYNLLGSPIKATTYDNAFKYLGIKYDPSGRLKPNLTFFDDMISRLKHAPLKPQQKLSLLRTNLIPKLTHQLVLGRITKGLLLSIDVSIRDFLKNILALPHDIPNSFFHTQVKAGGLGVPCFIDHVPAAIIRRIGKFKDSKDTVIRELGHLERTQILITKCYNILNIDANTDPKSLKLKLERRNEDILYASVDGIALREAKSNPEGQAWVHGNNAMITGRGYKNLIKLRIGRLATKENCSRGRAEADKKCRKCARVNETQTHVLQRCHFTHFIRMQRHDAICRWIQDESVKKGYPVTWEPKFKISESIKIKPDLVVELPEKVLIIDVTIVAENQRRQGQPNSTLKHWSKEKTDMYGTEAVKGVVSKAYSDKVVEAYAMVLSERGLWCRQNEATMEALGFPKSKRTIPIIRAMEGSIKCYNLFMRTT